MSISVVSPSMKNSSNFQYILSKPKRPYTEVIYEDDYSFHNVKIKGKSLQNPSNADTNKKCSKTQVCQPKTSLRNSLIRNREQHFLLTKWVESTAKIIKDDDRKENNKSCKKSIIVESVEKIQKNFTSNKPFKGGVRKLNQTNSDKMFTTTFIPSLQYQQKTFDQQTHCNFRQIIQEFNLAKKQIKQTQKEQQQRKQGKRFKPGYKKPNYYHYQQFFRQNYQAKQLKQTMFLFKKCAYLPRNGATTDDRKTQMKKQNEQSNCNSQRYAIMQKKQSNSKSRFNKRLGVYIYQQEKKQKQYDAAQKNFESLLALQPYLHVKTHEFSKTQRKSLKRKPNCMNKTSFNYSKNKHQHMEHQKIQPWNSADQAQVGF